jgi:putative SOS response-associated peptidase YedK
VCGRYGLFRDPSSLVRALGGRVPGDFRFTPHYNVAPTQRVLGLPNVPERELCEMRWGLVTNVPGGDPRRRISTINARIETVATSPLYGPLLPVRRCVLFADGYYEWQVRRDGSKQPMWIERRDRAPFAFAGLWDDASENGEAVVSCTIVTQPANDVLAAVHERMPVVLGESAARDWLSADRVDAEAALALLPPAPAREWTFHAVSGAVGNVRNDAPALIAAVAPESEAPSLFDMLES